MTEESISVACQEGKLLTVKSLLSRDPRLSIKPDSDERYPLHWAVSYQRVEIVKMLLDPFVVSSKEISGGESATDLRPKKFDIDIDDMVDGGGWTPLHVAASVGNIEVLELLLAHTPKPDVNQQTSGGQTPLHFAVSKNLPQIAEVLVCKAGASTRLKDKLGQYPIHRAASIGSLRLLKLLVEHGKSPVGAKDSYGWTPMHHAMAEGHGDFAVELVKLGADPHAVDSEGKTPVQVAVDAKVAQFFRENCDV
ncbi:unnamed protein product [Kuraishia capsulata CBS 1993]|uniref:Proteasome regulatory particle subunit n=1 Tax=Kuraishia capsulata CBS 1993 TaxID=1382522 RepID=W6MS86_9ASCO|nr:uncharacterized protein KUCA_T00000646001 [Kuraishia capsulata CBS 1993]CDK24680.1 unnamed protein product [Kuraishia capsulata CBS 1993]